ncbi:MAG: hypothetical protein K2P94_08395 [Rhodospirillaceae bacterium]|nr:hypothetical protein [Rhodospirillaceae bacterium]
MHALTESEIDGCTNQRNRLWSLVVALLIVAQVALAIHQIGHRLNPDLRASDECSLCQFASAMTDGPQALTIVVPTFVVIERLELAPAATPPLPNSVSGFRSRAPPVSV